MDNLEEFNQEYRKQLKQLFEEYIEREGREIEEQVLYQIRVAVIDYLEHREDEIIRSLVDEMNRKFSFDVTFNIKK
jgi:hypothetical protein